MTQPATHPALVKMFDECIKHQMPKGYQADFTTHDVNELAKHDPAEPFVWFLRENGTHLFFAPLDPVPDFFTHETRRFYVWAEDGLRFAASAHDATVLLRAADRAYQEVS